MINPFKNIVRNQRGSVSAEAALSLPFLIVIGLGAADGSMLMLQNHKMESGLMAAGNYLSKAESPQNNESTAKTLATTGKLSSGGTPFISNWSASDIAISYLDTANIDGQDGVLYRGGDTIRVIKLSSSFTYEGLGFIKTVSNGAVRVKAEYQERASGYIG